VVSEGGVKGSGSLGRFQAAEASERFAPADAASSPQNRNSPETVAWFSRPTRRCVLGLSPRARTDGLQRASSPFARSRMPCISRRFRSEAASEGRLPRNDKTFLKLFYKRLFFILADTTSGTRVAPAATQLAAATIQSVSIVAPGSTLFSFAHVLGSRTLCPLFPSDDQMP
jgi:hypothetical protein